MPDTSNFGWALWEHQESVKAATSAEDRRFDQEQLARANAVLEAVLTPFGDPFEDDPQRLCDEYKLKVNNAIKANLDINSLWSFMGIVAVNYKSIDASRKAHMKNAKNHADKQKVFAWCDENMTDFRSMDSAAYEIADSKFSQKFRTVRDWMTEWKKLRSAGTP